jgi:hypothetical protein
MCLFLNDSCRYLSTKDPGHPPDKGRIYCNSMAFTFVNVAWVYVRIQGPFSVVKILSSCEVCEVLETVNVKISIFGNMMPCGLMDNFP